MSADGVHADLPDADGRDAIRGRTPGSLDTTVFVDAGAGTGKTSALVDRVVSLLRSGVPVREIAAITFTEAAAAELRHRVRSAVEAAAADEADPAQEALLRAAIDSLDEAAFTTLHAFAQRILLDHPLSSGLPPELALMTDIESAAAFEQRWDAWLADFVSRPEVEPVLEMLDVLDVSIPMVRRLAAGLHTNYHRIPPDLAVEPTGFTPPPLDVTALRSEAVALRAAADQAAAADPADLMVENLRLCLATLDDAFAAVQQGAPLEHQLDLLGRVAALPLSRGGKQGPWGGKDELSAIRARRKAIRDDLIPAVVRGQYHALLMALAAWTSAFVVDWARERQDQGVLVFQDLLVLARNVLRDDPEVRAAVRAGYRNLLIDEFQDTDPIQMEIAVLLGAANDDDLATDLDADGAVRWQRATLVPGRLFFVGDPKQSIYRFRGADIRVYEGTKALVKRGGDDGVVHELTHNFRSVPGVLGWVNAAFDHLLVERAQAQPAYLALTGQRGDLADGSTVRTIGGPGGRAQDVRAAEALDVVRTVRSLIGSAIVHDQRTDEARPALASDIAVLVRRHATARQLERAFEDADLGLVVESRSLIYSTDEVRDLTILLTALDDPADEVAVVGALRHPAFGCSDRQLTQWASQGGKWWLPRLDAEPVDDPVWRALHRLAVLRRDRWEHTVGGYVEHVIAQLRLVELALVNRRYRDRWRRIRFVADQAHAFHEAGGHLRGFVRWLRDQADDRVSRDEHVVADADDDAVRVTTVHASKGLEYPIVIVLGLDTSERPVRDPELIWGDAGRLEINLGSMAKTQKFEELNDAERQFHAEEERRLLYVSTTRARDHLVLSLHHAERNASGCHADRLVQMGEVFDGLWSPLDLTGIDVIAPAEQPDLFAPAGPDTLADLAEFRAEHERHAREARRPRVLAATTIARQLAAVAADSEPGQDPEDGGSVGDDADLTADVTVDPTVHQPWRKGRSGTAIGRAVHAVLQSCDLSGGDDLTDLARAQCAAEGLPLTDATRVADMAGRALRSDIVIEAVTTGRYWRELHVGAPVAGVTVEGFIDLLVEAEDGLVVADYKTDSVRDRTPEQAIAVYRPQAAAYALILEEALGTPVSRCVFVLTQAKGEADRQVEIAGDRLRAAVSELRQQLGGGVLTAS